MWAPLVILYASKNIQCHWTTPACKLRHMLLKYILWVRRVCDRQAKRRDCVVDTSSYISIKVNLKVSDLGTALSWQSTVLVYANNHISNNQNSQTAPLCYTNSNIVNGLLLLEQNSEGLQFICYRIAPSQNGGTSIVFYKNIEYQSQYLYLCNSVIISLP